MLTSTSGPLSTLCASWHGLNQHREQNSSPDSTGNIQDKTSNARILLVVQLPGLLVLTFCCFVSGLTGQVMALNHRTYSFLQSCVKVQRQLHLLATCSYNQTAQNSLPLPQVSTRWLCFLPCGTNRPLVSPHTPALSTYRLYSKKGKDKGTILKQCLCVQKCV